MITKGTKILPLEKWGVRSIGSVTEEEATKKGYQHFRGNHTLDGFSDIGRGYKTDEGIEILQKRVAELVKLWMEVKETKQ